MTSILRRLLPILVGLISARTRLHTTSGATLTSSIYHLWLLLPHLLLWLILHGLCCRHHWVTRLLEWLPCFILCLRVYSRHHRGRMWRARHLIWLELWLLHTRRHHSRIRGIHCIMIPRWLRLVLILILHHLSLIDDRTRWIIGVAIVIRGPRILFATYPSI